MVQQVHLHKDLLIHYPQFSPQEEQEMGLPLTDQGQQVLQALPSAQYIHQLDPILQPVGHHPIVWDREDQ